MSVTHHHPSGVVARGFAQVYGLHPAIAFLTVCTDMMLFTGELASMGLSVFLALIVSPIIGYLAYRGQMRFYGDDHDAALVKAGMLALLTAIPTSLPMLLYIPAGLVGLFRRSSSTPQLHS